MATVTTGRPVHWAPQSNGPLMARLIPGGSADHRTDVQDIALTWSFVVERVTGIEPALSAWESVSSGLLCGLTCGTGYP